MSHIFQIPDEVYKKLEEYAIHQGKTPDDLFMRWVADITQPQAPQNPLQDEEEDIELDPNDPLMLLEGIISVPVELGWADDHDYYFAGGEYDDRKKQ